MSATSVVVTQSHGRKSRGAPVTMGARWTVIRSWRPRRSVRARRDGHDGYPAADLLRSLSCPGAMCVSQQASAPPPMPAGICLRGRLEHQASHIRHGAGPGLRVAQLCNRRAGVCGRRDGDRCRRHRRRHQGQCRVFMAPRLARTPWRILGERHWRSAKAAPDADRDIDPDRRRIRASASAPPSRPSQSPTMCATRSITAWSRGHQQPLARNSGIDGQTALVITRQRDDGHRPEPLSLCRNTKGPGEESRGPFWSKRLRRLRRPPRPVP